jgi:GNAT superfamily N-acetyltransferase
MTDVRELTTEAEWREAYPVMNELRPQSEETFVERMHQMYDEERYRLFAYYDDDDIVALAGVRELIVHYHGNHVWVYDLVTTESRRSEGIGAELLEWVGDWARERGANVVELASGLWRDEAHEFYEEKAGFERYCLTFKRDL